MFHTPEEEGFEPYVAPTEGEISDAGAGLIESYEGGGLRLVLEDYLELVGRLFESPRLLVLLTKLIQVAHYARHGMRYERAAMERIIHEPPNLSLIHISEPTRPY